MSTADPPLAGLRVLVTRPEWQADRLAALIREAGGAPIRFPTLVIEPKEPDGTALEALAQADLVIFISPNAVNHGYRFLRDLEDASDRTVVAVGRATRAALKQAGCRDVHAPGERSSSEEVLAQPVLHDVSGRRVCIVRGEGGRELLRETLAARGARVSYLECYRRNAPSRPDTATLARALNGSGQDDVESTPLVVTSTSTAGLDNLLQTAPARLLDQPLVVIGGRQAAAARERGWRGPVLAAGAGDEQLVEAIVAWNDGRQPASN